MLGAIIGGSEDAGMRAFASSLSSPSLVTRLVFPRRPTIAPRHAGHAATPLPLAIRPTLNPQPHTRKFRQPATKILLDTHLQDFKFWFQKSVFRFRSAAHFFNFGFGFWNLVFWFSISDFGSLFDNGLQCAALDFLDFWFWDLRLVSSDHVSDGEHEA
jgi:hypothetical protein